MMDEFEGGGPTPTDTEAAPPEASAESQDSKLDLSGLGAGASSSVVSTGETQLNMPPEMSGPSSDLSENNNANTPKIEVASAGASNDSLKARADGEVQVPVNPDQDEIMVAGNVSPEKMKQMADANQVPTVAEENERLATEEARALIGQLPEAVLQATTMDEVDGALVTDLVQNHDMSLEEAEAELSVWKQRMLALGGEIAKFIKDGFANSSMGSFLEALLVADSSMRGLGRTGSSERRKDEKITARELLTLLKDKTTDVKTLAENLDKIYKQPGGLKAEGCDLDELLSKAKAGRDENSRQALLSALAKIGEFVDGADTRKFDLVAKAVGSAFFEGATLDNDAVKVLIDLYKYRAKEVTPIDQAKAGAKPAGDATQETSSQPVDTTIPADLAAAA